MIRSTHGFTLVELMVVIAIIAILAVVGITIFSGVQKSARDGRRRGDINAIAKALEVNKTSGGYLAISDTWFAGGATPYDPLLSGGAARVPGCGDANVNDDYTNRCWYCVRSPSNTPGYCYPGSHYLNNSAEWVVDGAHSTPHSTSWIICANLENSPGFYCRGNQQ